MSTASFSFRCTWIIAGNTLLAAIRQRLLGCLLGFALAVVLAARWFRDFDFGAPELKFLADCGFGAMAFFGAALTITSTAQLFLEELEQRTVLTLLAKPVGRAEFVLGKFLGVMALMMAFCTLLTALLAFTLWWREGELMELHPDAFPQGRIVSYCALLAAGFLQWLKFTVLAAFALLIASFAQTPLFTVIAGFFVLLAGHLQYVAQDTYRRGASFLGHGLEVVLALVPNFHVFSLIDPLGAWSAPTATHFGRITLYGVLYALLLCALAVASFRRREI